MMSVLDERNWRYNFIWESEKFEHVFCLLMFDRRNFILFCFCNIYTIKYVAKCHLGY